VFFTNSSLEFYRLKRVLQEETEPFFAFIEDLVIEDVTSDLVIEDVTSVVSRGVVSLMMSIYLPPRPRNARTYWHQIPREWKSGWVITRELPGNGNYPGNYPDEKWRRAPFLC